MAVVWIPSLIRHMTDGRQSLVVQGYTVGEVIDEIDRAHPGVKDSLCENGRLKATVMIAVDGVAKPLGLAQPLKDDSEIAILPAVSGG